MNKPGFLALMLCWVVVTSAARGEQQNFVPERDTPIYANEMVFDPEGRVTEPGEGVRYTRRCFVMVRSAMQFSRFAKFDPELPRLEKEIYRKRIREISKRPPWDRREREPVLIPGFSSLRELSIVHGDLLREECGIGWPTYVRPGNTRMMMPSHPDGRTQLARWLARRIQSGEVETVFISKFPSMNHALLLHRVKRDGEDLVFTAYDPNVPDKALELRWLAEEKRFSYSITFYFEGGGVHVMRIYVSPFH